MSPAFWFYSCILWYSVWGRDFVPFDPYRPGNVLKYFPTSNTLTVGGPQGGLSFWSLNTATPVGLAVFDVSSATDVIDLSWNRVLLRLSVATTANRLFVYSFSSTSMIVSESKMLIHTYPVTCSAWDNTVGTNLLVGTTVGLIDEFTVSFTGATTNQALIPESSRSHRYFTGCHVAFIYRIDASTFVTGCSEGRVHWFTQSTPRPATSLTLGSIPEPFGRARYRRSGTYLISLFSTTVYVIDMVNRVLSISFHVVPYLFPLSPLRVDKVLDFDVYPRLGPPSKMVIRSTDTVAEYDLASVISGETAPSQWMTGLTVSELVTQGTTAVITVRQGTSADNDMFVEVDADTGVSGVIDFYPCWTPSAQATPVGEKRDITCTGSPTIAWDVMLPYQFTKIRGSFSLESLGTISAQDCSTMKGPIRAWDADQTSQWVRVGPSTNQANITPLISCPVVYDAWTLRPAFPTTVSECFDSCRQNLQCNTVQMQMRMDIYANSERADSLRAITNCVLRACPDPGKPPAPPDDTFEIWSFSDPSTTAGSSADFPGYIAFGSLRTVIHGGCATAGGLIPGTPVTITIPETALPADNTIRFQVSQYNAEAVVRVSDIQIDVFMDYVPPVAVLEEPSTSPGAYSVNVGLNPGSPSGPIVISEDGTTVATSDMFGNIAIFNLPLGS
jgi:hypothetical protein